MAFVRAGASWFRVNTRGRPAHPGARPQASLGATCPTLEISGQVPSVLDSSPCKRKASLPPGGPRIFPWATLPRSSPAPTEAQCPGRTWGPEGVSAPGLGSAICVGGQGRRDPRPGKGSPGGTQVGPCLDCLGSCFGSNRPNLHRGGILGPSGFHSLKSGLNYLQRDCDSCDLNLPELEPPSP